MTNREFVDSLVEKAKHRKRIVDKHGMESLIIEPDEFFYVDYDVAEIKFPTEKPKETGS